MDKLNRERQIATIALGCVNRIEPQITADLKQFFNEVGNDVEKYEKWILAAILALFQQVLIEQSMNRLVQPNNDMEMSAIALTDLTVAPVNMQPPLGTDGLPRNGSSVGGSHPVNPNSNDSAVVTAVINNASTVPMLSSVQRKADNETGAVALNGASVACSIQVDPNPGSTMVPPTNATVSFEANPGSGATQVPITSPNENGLSNEGHSSRHTGPVTRLKERRRSSIGTPDPNPNAKKRKTEDSRPKQKVECEMCYQSVSSSGIQMHVKACSKRNRKGRPADDCTDNRAEHSDCPPPPVQVPTEVHTSEGKFDCSQCRKECGNKPELIAHLREKNPGTDLTDEQLLAKYKVIA